MRGNRAVHRAARLDDVAAGRHVTRDEAPAQHTDRAGGRAEAAVHGRAGDGDRAVREHLRSLRRGSGRVRAGGRVVAVDERLARADRETVEPDEAAQVDGQRAVDVGDRVVREVGACARDGRARDDRVIPDRRRCRLTRARERDARDALAADEAGGGERRIAEDDRPPVQLGAVVRGDRQRLPGDRDRPRGVGCGLVVVVARLRRGQRARAGGGDVDRRAGDRAVAARRVGDGEVRRRGGAEGEVGVAVGLRRRCGERDRLTRLRDREAPRDGGCRLVVAIARLRRRDRAGACAGEVDLRRGRRTIEGTRASSDDHDRPSSRSSRSVRSRCRRHRRWRSESSRS